MRDVLNCKTFSYLYPLILNHVIIEAKFFSMIFIKLQNMVDLEILNKILLEELSLNWNEIMREHADFIRGYLDPTQIALFKTADAFAKEFAALQLKATSSFTQHNVLQENLDKNLTATLNLRNFKRQSTEGALPCKIKIITVPLFTDHVTREANHYLRILKGLTM